MTTTTSEHHDLGPSGAERWAVCTASPSLLRRLDLPNEETEWAAEGTVLHEIAAQCLEFGLSPYSFDLDQVTARQMQEGLDFLGDREFIDSVVEERVKTGIGDQFGTLDFGGLETHRLTVFDWKWGAGVPVSPVENLQLACYAYGLGKLFNLEGTNIPVDFVIWQPRIEGAGGVWSTTMQWVAEKVAWLQERFDEAVAGPGEFNPGEKTCRFCPARKQDRCDSHAAWRLDQIGLAFDDLSADLEDVELMTDARRAELWRAAPGIRSWLKQVEGRLLADRQAEGEGNGLKAVYGRQGDRFWTDEGKAKVLMQRHGVKATKEVVLSPAQAEKELPPSARDDFNALVAQQESQPKLVESTDPRPAITPVEDHFEVMK